MSTSSPSSKSLALVTGASSSIGRAFALMRGAGEGLSTPSQTQSPESFKLEIEPFQCDARVFGGEAPVSFGVALVSIALPGCRLTY